MSGREGEREAAVSGEWVCERVCEYAMDVGVPEFAGLRGVAPCGNCDHYAPSAAEEDR